MSKYIQYAEGRMIMYEQISWLKSTAAIIAREYGNGSLMHTLSSLLRLKDPTRLLWYVGEKRHRRQDRVIECQESVQILILHDEILDFEDCVKYKYVYKYKCKLFTTSTMLIYEIYYYYILLLNLLLSLNISTLRIVVLTMLGRTEQWSLAPPPHVHYVNLKLT